jgi:signal transduction histidine kinase
LKTTNLLHAILKRSFENFYSSDHAGLGIGLDISRWIALSQGGTLAAEGRHPTCVRLRLNLAVRPSED